MTIVTNSVSKTPLDTALSQIIWYILEPYTKKFTVREQKIL